MEYFVTSQEKQLGPFSLQQVQTMLREGQIRTTDHVWAAPMPDWVQIKDHPAFSTPPPLPAGAGIRREPTIGTPGPEPTPTADMSLTSMYEAFLGPEKAAYYSPIFQRFDAGGSALSWNWPAALITQLWMLYRGMFLWGFLGYPILSWVASLVVTLTLTAALGKSGTLIAYAVTLVGSFVVTGLFGNKILHDHVHKMINRSGTLGLSPQARREWLIRKGSGNFVIVIVLFFVAIAIIGILAAIAIPAYQDYVIRSQVSEGAMLAGNVKTAVVDYYSSKGRFPSNNLDADLPGPGNLHGKYVTGIEVSDDIIRVTYGGQANTAIAGKILVYEGSVSTQDGRVTWRCNTAANTVPVKYLPIVCRR